MRFWAAAFLLSVSLFGERLPIQPLTTAQGLAGNSIKKIFRDSRGFIWFCTSHGLSRFDGYQFANFGEAQGLPGRVARDIIESRSGDYWVATSGGLAGIPSSGYAKIIAVYPGDDARSRNVFTVHESSEGTLWAGTEAGLYRMSKGSGLAKFDTGPLPETWNEPAITALQEDGVGNLWFGGYAGVGRISRDGRVTRWTPRHGFVSYVVPALYRDRDGTMWAGTERGLCRMRNDPEPGESPAERCYGREDGLPGLYIQAILRSSKGELWVGTVDGAARGHHLHDGALRFTSITSAQGLTDDNIEAVAQDSRGNIWLGSSDDGAMKLSSENIVLFGESDGLAEPNAIALFAGPRGTLYCVTRSNTNLHLHQFAGSGFRKLAVSLPASVRAFGRGLQQVALQDRSGDWWLATGDGLLRYSAAGSRTLQIQPRVYTRPNGPDGANVFRLYEDSRGDIWWSTSSRIVSTLGRWSRSRQTMEFFKEQLPLGAGVNPVSAFVEDKTGVLWIGFESGDLARRRDGAFEYFAPRRGSPGVRIRDAYRDGKGRLWFASAVGLWRLDDPSAARPAFRVYTRADGLSGEVVHSITGDFENRIYAGVEDGVDRIDPESGRVDHFSALDGLPAGVVQAAFTDRSGNLWFGTRRGIARFVPQAVSGGGGLSRVLITAIRVKGLERQVSAAGESNLSMGPLRAEENPIEFGFSVPESGGGADLQFEYRLEGAGNSNWVSLGSRRAVNFAGLPPGSYRIEVRTAGSEPATAAFRILPPVWATSWFRLSAALAAAGLIYASYRYRIHLALEREQLRMRIATDLHDDIGSNLSRIAIWSEVAAQEAGRSGGSPLKPLVQIGDVSRETIDSMSDIVWAVNPRFDRFSDLASRMRRYVSDLTAGTKIRIAFAVQGEDRDAPVGPAVRREVFLVFKEALNNVLRHSHCSECRAALSLESGWLILTVSDDGTGFHPNQRGTGNGLDSMARRTKRLGGMLRIDSAPGSGARIEMRIPRSAGDRAWRIKSLHT